MRTILLLLSVSFFASVSHAQTIVVEDTNLLFSASASNFGGSDNHVGTVCQDLSCDETAVFFDYSSSAGTIEAVNTAIDEESDWYVLGFGEEFSSASIAANQHPIIFTTDNPRGPVSIGGPDIYLGVSTGVGFQPIIDPISGFSPPNRDVFGWVHLRDNGGELEFVSSAMAYGSEGIFAGTTTAVPEPASGTGILLLSIIAALSRTRRI